MDYDNEVDRYAGVKRKMRFIGGSLIAVGLILFITGWIIQMNVFTSVDMNSDPGDIFSKFTMGSMMIFIGFPMIGIGCMILWFSFIGVVYRFLAREVKPAVTDLSEGTGVGFSRGTRRGGGIRFDMSEGRYPRGNDIRVRCRKCKNLEKENARFCSNCGARM